MVVRSLAVALVVGLAGASAEAQTRHPAATAVNPMQFNNPLAQGGMYGSNNAAPYNDPFGQGGNRNAPVNGQAYSVNVPFAVSGGYNNGYYNPMLQGNWGGGGFYNPMNQGNWNGGGYNNPLATGNMNMNGVGGSPLIPNTQNPLANGVGNANADATLNGTDKATRTTKKRGTASAKRKTTRKR